MLAWSQGCEFEELHKYADLADGDFVRSFRLVIDFLRQTRRAMAGHVTLLDKLDLCVAKINRDVVDAERQLRIRQSNASPGEIPVKSDDTGDASGNLGMVGDTRVVS